MKIKSISNKGDILGAGIIYSLLLLLLFGGLAYKYDKLVLLIPLFVSIKLVIFLHLRKLRGFLFYTDRLEVAQFGVSDKRTRYEISDVELKVEGGSKYVPNNSFSVSVNGKKIILLKLNDREWEFEEFYHETSSNGYKWKVHETVKAAHAKNYALFLKRLEVMDRNR